VRGAPLSRPALIARVLPIEKKFFALATRHVNAANADVSNLARALFVHHAHFFTFVHEEGVEPTNNVAERALRAAVQWRSSRYRDDTHYPEFRTMPSREILAVSGAAFGRFSSA